MDGFDLPGYRLLRKLSETNMSVVYQAEELELGDRLVAIKVLKPDLAHDSDYTARFQRELSASARLSHPNIVPVHAGPRGSAPPHLVMPFIDGTTLAAVLAREGRLDLPWTVHIVRQIAAALDYAHGRGWVHRDVKPGNIMLHPAGHTYLIDFGIAAELEVERRTEVGRTVGTPGYLAPELRSDAVPVAPADTATADTERAPVTPQADVYSLGVVAYRCLTARLPHDDQDTGAARWLSRTGEPPAPVSVLRPDLPPAIDQVVAKALAAPGERYATCTRFADALAAVASPPEAGPAPVPGPPPAPPARRPGRLGAYRNPLVAGVAALALIAAFIVIVRLGTDGSGGPDLSRVPPALIGDCVQSSPGFPGAATGLLCRDGRQEIRFGLFADQSEVDKAYATVLREAGVPRGTGDCGRATRAEHRFPGTGDRTGRVVCWSESGTTTLVWTDERRRTLARAETSTGDLAASWARWVGAPAYPTEAESELAGLVAKPGCQRAAAGTLESFDDLTAAIECEANSALATSVTYYRFGGQDGLRRTFQARVDDTNPPGGVLCVDDPPGFVGNRRYDLRSVDVGEMLCYPGERGNPTLEWTVEPLLLLAKATGRDAADLTEWWRRGIPVPLGKVVSAVNKRAEPAFPDARERDLLSHIPQASRVNCMRPAAGQVRDIVVDASRVVAAVTCGPTAGAAAVFYYRFSDLDSMNAAHAANLDTSGPNCAGNPKPFVGDAPYSRRGDTGRLGCGQSGKQPFLAWTSDKLRIATFAFQGYDADSLLEWWRDAGPV
ncbi:protein kinase domain-containing protein [Actinophytocola sp.]|uniref:serine/threonine-protein kinase n=1 Tax=Actinophytocola sp. TaxID=1872138 RepID=UPI003D6BC8CA